MGDWGFRSVGDLCEAFLAFDSTERQNGVFNHESYQVTSWRPLLRANHFPGTEKDLSRECTSCVPEKQGPRVSGWDWPAPAIDKAIIIMNTYFYKHYLIHPFQELYELSITIILLSPFYGWGNWSKERFSNCPRQQQERVEVTWQFDLRLLVFKIHLGIAIHPPGWPSKINEVYQILILPIPMQMYLFLVMGHFLPEPMPNYNCHSFMLTKYSHDSQSQHLQIVSSRNTFLPTRLYSYYCFLFLK